MKRLEPYQKTDDARGQFFGLTRETWAEVNLISTRAGQVRGNHYHSTTRELFCILSGRIAIEIENIRTGEKMEFEAGAGDLFVVEPFDLHTFRTRTDSTWLNMLSQPFDAVSPDFHHRAASGTTGPAVKERE